MVHAARRSLQRCRSPTSAPRTTSSSCSRPIRPWLLSKVFNDDWMGGFGFLRADGPVVSDIIDRRNTDVPELLYVQPHQKVSEAVAIMRDNGVSQLPVGKGEMPLAAAEIAGSVSELRLMELAFETDAVLDKTVEDVMAAPLPTIGAGQPVALAVEMLESPASRARWRPPPWSSPRPMSSTSSPTPREPERWPMTFSPMPRCSASRLVRSAGQRHDPTSGAVVTPISLATTSCKKSPGPPGL